MSFLANPVQLAVETLLRFLLGIYFRRVEIFHAERVPAGPVLFVANHPGSVTDAFIVGTSLPRRAHFLATAQLFRLKPLAWFLRNCGIIPLNRREDDPTAMRSVAGSFDAAFRVLERGEAVVIFPEGVTYDDAQLKALKSGAARLALELEHRQAGKLGLQIVPLGLTYSAKERFRSTVLVFFGEPVAVAGFLPQYTERRKECINGLTAKIARRLQALLVHQPQMEREHLVAAVKRLYLARLRLGNIVIDGPVAPLAEEVILSKAIVDAVEFAHREMPEHLAAFQVHLHRYERMLQQMHLPESAVEELAAHRHATPRILGLGSLAMLLFPVAAVGWLHWRLPHWLVEKISARFMHLGKRKAQTAHSHMFTGLVVYGAFLAVYFAMADRWFSQPVAVWYALSLPVAGLIGHYYLQEVGRLAAAVRTTAMLLRAPLARKRILRMRARLIREIEAVRKVYRPTLTPGLIPGTDTDN